ncbi:IS3-like element ISBcen9 family transposase [Burkholderia cenocepacia]|uniref:IS3-like element ISBcen9 family transposase n=2 Tax=Burkholderia cenocepacia TaxID=95486 RepID=UPI000A2F8589|nr:IS3-like element ISBcen9 family transposase [Pseudomonas aeruginosa]PNE63069.1 IS3-like element ISBcen9 family transposase [Burkholderia cenocepacia]PNE63133.1 IS3-like element ISBcen9 family transposase [Burkholderia cenocepacia]PNE63147.1 IS3-like element ISBcen9 family transposase [Burkholderia cenocepacia]PNE63179.1 IS3-like element ISBcen9 family transposase [Burkholderia cenocepacia]
MARYTEQFKLSVVKRCIGGEAIRAVARTHGLSHSTVSQWYATYQAHGKDGVRRKYNSYDVAFRLKVVQHMREHGVSSKEAAARFNIRNPSAVLEWARRYDDGGLTALAPRPKGRRPTAMPKTPPAQPLNPTDGTDTRTREDLLQELNYLRMENAYPKKAEGLGSGAGCTAQKAQIVLELRQQFPLAGLLRVAGLARSTFYYQCKALAAPDRHASVKAKIRALFEQHKGRYGYRRITLALRRLGQMINHKTVARLMRKMQLKSCVRVKKYRAYRGNTCKTAPHLLQRQFHAARPNEKWVTDITEFSVGGQKLYLSPVLDLYNGEIIAYQTHTRPAFQMVTDMLRKALRRLQPDERPMLHSDQGWHYQMPGWRLMLEQRSLAQSMSRKGNCLDNAAMESFFGTLKSEFFYLNHFSSIEQLRIGLKRYIRYYNHERIKLKLKGLSPVQYRTQPHPA